MKAVKKTALVFLSIIFCAGMAAGKNIDSLAAGRIDKTLLANADVVIRSAEKSVEVVSLNEMHEREHVVMTILNEHAERFAHVSSDFSRLKKITKISATLYDADGKELKRLKESDFITAAISAQPGYYDDDKMKYYHFVSSYPYTIEYTIETRQNHTFFLPGWTPQKGSKMAVAHTSFTVQVPADFELRYKAFNIDAKPQTGSSGNGKTYSWELANIPAKAWEPYSCNDWKTHPLILLAGNRFKIEDYEGNMSDWKSYGQFTYDLNKDRDQLPEPEKAKVRSMIAGLTTDKEKIAVLYRYLQDNFRYVSIQYGIGGWQTLDAAFLCEKKYGDCKALSNYMMAMLGVAGIKAYPVLISAGEQNDHSLVTDFPSNQFNHVIITVPTAKDTVWLECTSNKYPVGFLGDFTGNRNGLMITPQGGYVVHTPIYSAAENEIIHHAKAAVTEDGSLDVQMENKYTGMPAMDLVEETENKSAHDLDLFVNSKFKLSGYTVNHLEYKKPADAFAREIDENINITASNMFSRSSNRGFLNVNLAPMDISVAETGEDRTMPFVLSGSYTVQDSFTIKIPANYTVESLPEPVSETYSFGSFHYKIEQKNDELTVNRVFVQNGGTYEASLYKKYEALVTDAINTMHYKVILKNK